MNKQHPIVMILLPVMAVVMALLTARVVAPPDRAMPNFSPALPCCTRP